ncbi:MAG: GNAT family N-acetyltransferase [Erythrobacter sp.]
MSTAPSGFSAADFKSQADHIMAVMQPAFDPMWGEAWNRRQVEDALTFPTIQCIVMDRTGAGPEETGEPAAGFVLTRFVAGEEELLLIAVAPQFRRRGLGRKLIDQMVLNARHRGAEQIFLEMRRDNPAETLYRQVGFEPIGKRPDYYLSADGSRIDAITFGLKL